MARVSLLLCVLVGVLAITVGAWFGVERVLFSTPLTHYEVLNIPRHATKTDIRKAYRAQSLVHHPDKANNGDTAAFVRLTEAYEVLSSPPRRRTYDKQLVEQEMKLARARAIRRETALTWVLDTVKAVPRLLTFANLVRAFLLLGALALTIDYVLPALRRLLLRLLDCLLCCRWRCWRRLCPCASRDPASTADTPPQQQQARVDMARVRQRQQEEYERGLADRRDSRIRGNDAVGAGAGAGSGAGAARTVAGAGTTNTLTARAARAARAAKSKKA